MRRLLTSAQLDHAQKRRGLLGLMCGSFFSWTGFFMVIPLVAVHYVDNLGWAAGTVGIVLAGRQFAQAAFTTIFGMVADALGPRILIVSGMVVRALGFAAMGFAETFWTAFAAAGVIALGGAMFESPKSAAISVLANPEERRRYYATVGMIGGVGTAVGTQLGAFLITYDFRIVCLAAGAAYVAVSVVLALTMPPVAASEGSGSPADGARLVLRDSLFIGYVAVVAGYWLAWTQFGLTIVLAAVEVSGTERSVSWLYLVNTVVTIGLGYLLPRVTERWLSALQMQIAGISILGVGMLMVGLGWGFPGLLVAAGVISLGAVLARPGQETVLANLAHPSARGTYFGFSALALALGGGVGSYLGGVIYDVAGGAESVVPWAIFGGAAFAAALLLWINRERFSIVRS